jgi:hypothetical protein
LRRPICEEGRWSAQNCSSVRAHEQRGQQQGNGGYVHLHRKEMGILRERNLTDESVDFIPQIFICAISLQIQLSQSTHQPTIKLATIMGIMPWVNRLPSPPTILTPLVHSPDQTGLLPL